MPRQARVIEPGTVVHVISRFSGGRYFMAGPEERRFYLRSVERLATKFDGKLISYALMSTHVHWSVLVGLMRLCCFFHPLNTSFATWLNATGRATGAVFHSRYRSVAIEGDSAAPLIIYHHNNPPRAGVVADPLDSRWTSHRAYVGVEPAPPWLDVALGLTFCGLPDTARGRERFAEAVYDRRGEPRSDQWSGGDWREAKRAVRSVVGPNAELATPTVAVRGDALEVTHQIVARAEMPMRRRWHGHPEAVIRRATIATGVSVDELLSRQRSARLVSARRLILLVWVRHLGRPAIEMASALGISGAAATQLLSRTNRLEPLREAAEQLAAGCWASGIAA